MSALNDPFGRHARREERHYRNLCRTLREAGVDDAAAAERTLQGMGRSTWVFGLTGTVTALVVGLAMREMAIPVLAIWAVLALWLLTTNLRARRLIRRYMREELGAQRDGQENA